MEFNKALFDNRVYYVFHSDYKDLAHVVVLKLTEVSKVIVLGHLNEIVSLDPQYSLCCLCLFERNHIRETKKIIDMFLEKKLTVVLFIQKERHRDFKEYEEKIYFYLV